MRIDVQQELTDIFGDSPSEIVTEVELPSKGVFYPNRISKVKIRPLVFEDEKLVLQARKARTDVTDSLLTACIFGVSPEFVSNLVMMDKMFLIVKLREISFGKALKSIITCPHCKGSFSVNIDLAQIPIIEFDKDEHYLSFELPKLKKPVKLKPCRSRDSKIFDPDGNLLYAELYRFIESLAGKTETLIISEALKKLSAVDTQTIVARITLAGYGLDPRFEYSCEGEGGCGYKGLMSIPLDEDFFSVRSSIFDQT